MSNTPPPPFPPVQPGGFPGGPPAPFTPGWQPQPSPFLTPSPEPRKSSKLPLVIGIAVAVVVIAVALVFVLGGDDEETKTVEGINAAGARSGLETVIEDASFDENGNDDFRRCPMGDIDDLTALAATVVDLDDDVIEGTEQMGAVEEDVFPAYVDCQNYSEEAVRSGPNNVYFQAILDPPRDYEDFIIESSGDQTDVTFEDDTEEYLGGEIFMFCAEERSEDGYTGCDADWVDRENDIALNVFLGGSDAELDDAVEVLKLVLPVMADNLATHARIESES